MALKISNQNQMSTPHITTKIDAPYEEIVSSRSFLSPITSPGSRQAQKKLQNITKSRNLKHLSQPDVISQRSARLPQLYSNDESNQRDTLTKSFQPLISTKRDFRVERKDEMEKKILMMDKLSDLKNSLYKYQDCIDELLYPAKSDIKKIIKGLELLKEDDNHVLHDFMEIIIRILKMALFVNPKLVQMFQGEIDKLGSAELIKLSSHSYEQPVTYFAFTHTLLREIQKDIVNNTLKAEFDKKLGELKSQLTIRDNEIDHLKFELSQAVSRELFEMKEAEIKELRNNTDTLKETIKKLEKQVGDLNEDIEVIRDQYDDEVANNQTMVHKVKVLEEENHQILESTDASRKKVKEAQAKMNLFRDNFDKIIVRLGFLRQDLLELRKQNQELQAENEKLGLRAAASFDNLTPRPAYQELAKAHEIELDIYDNFNTKQVVPTRLIVEELMKKAADRKSKWTTLNFKDLANSQNPLKQGTSQTSVPKSPSGKKRASVQPQKMNKLNIPAKNDNRKSVFLKPVGFGGNNNLSQDEGTSSVIHEEDSARYTPDLKKLASTDSQKSFSKSPSKMSSETDNVDGPLKIEFPKKKEAEKFGETVMKDSNDLIGIAVQNKNMVDSINNDFDNMDSPRTKYLQQMKEQQKQAAV